MGHTKKYDLLDVQSELKRVGSFNGVKEKKPGIFYYKTIPFLHFHDKDGKRWADIKTADGWLHVDVPFDADATDRKKFIEAAIKAHALFEMKARAAR